MTEPIRYFVPGPAFVLDETLEAAVGPMVGHRTEDFNALYTRIQPKLAEVFRTTHPVLWMAGSATLAMEAAIASLVPNRILHLVGGGFGERWLEISRSRGLDAVVVEVPWGDALDPEQVRRALRGNSFDAVAITHCETSTGVLNPLREIAAVVHEESDALVLADCVSSLAGAPFEFDEWGIDLALSGTQKAIAVPPGIAVLAASTRAYERAAVTENRGWYLDILRHHRAHEEGYTLTTPALATARSLDVSLTQIVAEGLEARWKRHASLMGATERWAAGAGFTFASAEGFHSPTISCVRPPEGIEPGRLLGELAAGGFTVASGYGRFGADTIRIGHMGEVGLADLDALLSAVDEAVKAIA